MSRALVETLDLPRRIRQRSGVVSLLRGVVLVVRGVTAGVGIRRSLRAM